MKIISATIYSVNIPFRWSFSHSLHTRAFSDSIIVKLTTENGIIGYGEGIARPYVTGETVEASVQYIQQTLLPSIIGKPFEPIDPSKSYKALSHIFYGLSSEASPGIIDWNGSKAAVELAIIDCLLKEQRLSLSSLIPARSKVIRYSVVISSESVERTRKIAILMKIFNIKYIKIKVGTKDDYERIAIVRKIMGPAASIRLDANGSFNVKTSVDFLSSVSKFNIDSIEQPVPRGEVSDLLQVKSNSQIPIMVDESIVTIDDANKLIESNACHYFNLRIAKCGGIYNTLKIADLAKRSGMGIQLGCLVGETAILSAAGRAVAMHLNDLKFIEGSFGKLLLKEDVSKKNIRFGWGGKAKALTGIGLGIDVCEERIKKYATQIINL
jgi:L-Ala-D/L-Glu epimerase